jgi:hypothetical protein
MKKSTKVLTPKKLQNKIVKNLIPIEKMSFLEQYAIFMGKAQIIELALSGLLIHKYKYTENKVEKFTLGTIINELEKSGLRPDLIVLLKELLKYRNSLAHEFLGITAMGNKLAGNGFERLQYKELHRGLYQAEQVIHVYDFLTENKYI